MLCHFCHREAVRKCVSCGLGICPEHGERYCQVCSGAVFSKDQPSGQGEGKAYLQCPPKPQMETIYIDDDGPPECYRCQALARRVCQNCHNLFCQEHAGKGDWCDQCTKAGRLGNWLTVGIVVVLAGLSLLFYFLNQLPLPR
jgi:hypothetical protein